MASKTRIAFFVGSQRFISVLPSSVDVIRISAFMIKSSFEPAIIYAAMRANKPYFNNLLLNINNFPDHHIPWVLIVQMTMVKTRRIYNLTIISPFWLNWPFLFNLKFKQKEIFRDISWQFVFLLFRASSEIHLPREFFFIVFLPGGRLCLKSNIVNNYYKICNDGSIKILASVQAKRSRQ